MSENKKIGFRIIEIKTDQFAIFEENHDETKEVNLETNLSFGLDPENSIFLVSVKYTFEVLTKPFLTVKVTCFFKVNDSNIEDFKNLDTITFPKGFVQHMAMITVGTSRGILHAKTEGTVFNKYILPTIDVATMIPDDISFN